MKVHFDSWGRFAVPVPPIDPRYRVAVGKIEKETPMRYRVRFLESWPRGDQYDLVYVPKWAVEL